MLTVSGIYMTPYLDAPKIKRQKHKPFGYAQMKRDLHDARQLAAKLSAGNRRFRKTGSYQKAGTA